MLDEQFKQFCKEKEAFETARWAIESVLEVEVLTHDVFDPCVGLGALTRVARAEGYEVYGCDIYDWGANADGHLRSYVVCNFLSGNVVQDLRGFTVVMNPPFSLACQFVDKARELGARKIICFQRQAWRESLDRRTWWEENPPARVWVCGARAACWRFDMLACKHRDAATPCPNIKRKAKANPEYGGCKRCMGSTPTSHAWFVWERGHKGAEVTSAIYPTEELTT